MDTWERITDRKRTGESPSERCSRGLWSRKSGLAASWWFLLRDDPAPLLSEAPKASQAAHIVISFKCSGSYFLPAGLEMTSKPAEGKSPAKSKPVICLLAAPGCLCFRQKGMGGTSFAFPFLLYFWMPVYLNTYTYVYLFSQAGHSNRAPFFLTGLPVRVWWGWGCVGTQPWCHFGQIDPYMWYQTLQKKNKGTFPWHALVTHLFYSQCSHSWQTINASCGHKLIRM